MKNKAYTIIPHDKALHFIAGVCIFAGFNIIYPYLAESYSKNITVIA